MYIYGRRLILIRFSNILITPNATMLHCILNFAIDNSIKTLDLKVQTCFKEIDMYIDVICHIVIYYI